MNVVMSVVAVIAAIVVMVSSVLTALNSASWKCPHCGAMRPVEEIQQHLRWHSVQEQVR